MGKERNLKGRPPVVRAPGQRRMLPPDEMRERGMLVRSRSVGGPERLDAEA